MLSITHFAMECSRVNYIYEHTAQYQLALVPCFLSPDMHEFYDCILLWHGV